MDKDKKVEGKPVLTLKNVRDVVILAFFGVLSIKVFGMDLSLDIKEFTFTDRL